LNESKNILKNSACQYDALIISQNAEWEEKEKAKNIGLAVTPQSFV